MQYYPASKELPNIPSEKYIQIKQKIVQVNILHYLY